MVIKRKDILRKPEERDLESDKELIHRFGIKTFKNASKVIHLINCEEITGIKSELGQSSNHLCKSCRLYQQTATENKCKLIIIRDTANEIMWAINNGEWRDEVQPKKTISLSNRKIQNK